MMRLARIVRVASELDGSVKSLPRPCKNAQASSNASQIVRVLLNSNASGFSTMTQTPHARDASVRERTDTQKGPVMQWIAGSVALRQRLDHLEATSATVGSRATVLSPCANCSHCGVTMPLTSAEYRRRTFVGSRSWTQAKSSDMPEE
jgi:hypothetical protein